MAIAYFISLVLRGNGVTWTWLDGWCVPSFEMVASVLVLVRAVVSPRDRGYCLFLGLGGASWAAGDFAMTLETLHGATPATLSAANVLWAGFYPLAYIGVMLLMRRDVQKLTAANYLDGVIAALVTAAALVAFAFHGIATAAGGGNEAVAVNLIYPIGDLLLFGLTALGFCMLPRGQRMRWGLIAVAGLLNAAGDISALFGGIAATHVGFILNSGAWPESLTCISAAVWLPSGSRQPPRESNASGFLVPSVAAGLALIILFVGSIDHQSRVVVGFATATLVAAGARFYLALKRMTQLTAEREHEREHAANAERESLERAAAAERESQARIERAEREASERAQVAERESLERTAAAEREAIEQAAATERELLERTAIGERRSREIIEHAVRSYSQFAARVADGDLTATVEPEGDEELQTLAGSLNRMVTSLADISRQIQGGVHAIGSSTAEILTSANEHSSGAARQSDAITRASVTVSALRAAADDMTKQAQEVARESSASLDVSAESTGALEAIAEAMEQIRARVESIADEIVTLSDRTQQIGDITETVNDLADRSNLLALNASIEAARAGEHGRGFAVVAEQVRGLSEQSKTATARIESILTEIRDATDGAVRASQDGTRVVDQGVELTDRAKAGIHSLTDTIRAAAIAAEQIAATAEHQSLGMDQIAQTMRELESGTTKFLDGAEHSTRAAQELDQLSGQLASATARYQVSPKADPTLETLTPIYDQNQLDETARIGNPSPHPALAGSGPRRAAPRRR